MLDEEPGFAEMTSTSNREEIASNVCDFITLNPNPTYPKSVVSSINKDTRVSAVVVEKILQSLHSHNQYNILYDIILLILSRSSVAEREDICRPSFFAAVKKGVISSKNNPDVRKIQSLINQLLKNIKIPYEKYSNVQQIQIRNVVIYGLLYNLRRSACQVGRSIFVK